MTTIRVSRNPPAWQRTGFQQTERPRGSPGVPTLSRVSSAGLGGLFDSAWQFGNDESLGALHATCAGFVHRLRDDGVLPEHVLVAMKREITEGGHVHRAPSLVSPFLGAEDLERACVYEKLFHWFLESYFEA